MAIDFMGKGKSVIFLIALMLIFFLINYSWVNSYFIRDFSNKENTLAARVVDGDTIETGNHVKIRLLGINCPEKGEEYYAEAKSFLESLILNKTIELESGKENRDLYNRSLRYIFIDGKNANLELIKNGLANAYFPSGKDKHYNEFFEAWDNCLSKNINLCEKSKDKCAECIEVKEWDYKKDILTFYNKCSFDCDISRWTIKDEGRKKYTFDNSVLKSNSEITITSKDFGEIYVWTKTGDSLFLRDDGNKLVLYKNY